MKLKKVACAMGLTIAMGSPMTYAASDINPFAECGIGAMLFENDTAAMISNIVWDLGTTAVTSGISSPGSCSGAEAKTASFIYKSYDQVAEQTAKGQGDHLTAMLNLAGCASSVHSGVISDTRKDFSVELGKSEYSNFSDLQKAENYYNIVMSNTRGVCTLS